MEFDNQLLRGEDEEQDNASQPTEGKYSTNNTIYRF